MLELVIVIIITSYILVKLTMFWFKTITKDCECKDEYWFLDKKHNED